MSVSQNKKNEQQNNLCTTLTEQWKKGELKKNKYWVKYKSGKIDTWELSEGITIESKPEIIEVLAPVPSYDEWKTVFNCANKYEVEYIECANDYENVKKENQQLKELLYKCREKLDWLNGGYDVWGGELTDFIEEIDNAIGEKK